MVQCSLGIAAFADHYFFHEGMTWFGIPFLLLIGCVWLLKHSRSWHRVMIVWLMLRNNKQRYESKEGRREVGEKGDGGEGERGGY